MSHVILHTTICCIYIFYIQQIYRGVSSVTTEGLPCHCVLFIRGTVRKRSKFHPTVELIDKVRIPNVRRHGYFSFARSSILCLPCRPIREPPCPDTRQFCREVSPGAGGKRTVCFKRGEGFRALPAQGLCMF